MRLLPALSAVIALSVPATSIAQDASVAKDTKRFSLSLERFASASATFFSMKDGDDDYKLRIKNFSAGGPVSTPLGAPRVGLDYLTSFGMTVGAGLAFSLNDFDSKNGESRDEGGLSLLMLNPRIGYRIKATDWLDITPRVGATLGWVKLTGDEHQECDYRFTEDGETIDNCRTVEGDSINASATLVDLEVVSALRLTPSLNFLAGLSYDIVVGAEVEEEDSEDGSTEGESLSDEHLSSLQLWFGLGGYL